MAATLRKISPEIKKENLAHPKPFLKWAGGKTQLLPDILKRFPKTFRRYHEPFLGGGAVFFALQPTSAILSDINGDLIETYGAVRDHSVGLMRALNGHENTEEAFYKVRAQGRSELTEVQSAARTIYLNKTCFNGLYRVNKKGQFNVPFGKYRNPKLYKTENISATSSALKRAELRISSVFEIEKRVQKGDLVYFDPPYVPVSKTSSFTSYAKQPFGMAEQESLAEVFGRLAKRGVHVVLSNSDTPEVRELYNDFLVETVYARRAINSRADRRGKVTEVLVSAGPQYA